MEVILDFFGMSKLKSTNRGDDDRTDRLSRDVTVTMLIFFAVTITTKTFVGDPIECWAPAQFTGAQEDYVNSYCWVRNTYFLASDEDVPSEHDRTPRNEITYYQWVPLILLGQAMFFYLPYAIWKNFGSKTGLDLNSIVAAGESFNATETAEVRDKTISYMTSQVDRYVAEAKKRSYKSRTISFKQLLGCCQCLKGSYLYSLYIVIKILFVVNAVLQFLLVNALFGGDFSSYGWTVIKASMMNGTQLWSKRFPRSTMCFFKVRFLGNILPYNVQCVLPINNFNEKIFIFLWFWFIGVIITSSTSLVLWIGRMSPQSKLVSYVKRHIQYSEVADNAEEEEDLDNKNKRVKQFVDYLGKDGVFVARMIAMNADTITASDFVYALFKNFKNKKWINSETRSKPSAPNYKQGRMEKEEEEEDEVDGGKKSHLKNKLFRKKNIGF